MALLVFSTLFLAGAGLRPASASHAPDVTAVSGSAFNYYTNVSLFGGPYMRRGYGQAAGAPAAATSPSVTCPAAGGTTSVTDADGAKATYGPAVIFGGKWPADQSQGPPSGPLTSGVDCQLGHDGHSTASTSVTLMPAGSAYPGGAGPGPFVADEAHSTCTLKSDGSYTATTTIVNGILETSYDKDTQEPKTTEPIPVNPPVNYERFGTIDHVGDHYRIVFNEQVVNPDRSVTVVAAHMYLLGPVAVGDMFVGSSTCGPLATAAGTVVPVPAAGTTDSSTTTTVVSTTTTVPVTTTTAPATTTTTGPTGSVTGSAFGFFTDVSLFGGPSKAKGPLPQVALPAGGSADPVTQSAPTGISQYGPAILFQSGQIKVSTQGTPGSTGSVASAAEITGVAEGPGPFLYKGVSSTCTANQASTAGSTTINGGVLETKYDVNSQEPIASVPLALNPAPNTELSGTIDHVGDRFRIVFNEQAKTAAGVLTVNAAHMYLLGPTAVGEMIIGQSVCGMSATAVAAQGAAGTTGPAATAAGTAGRTTRGALAATGSSPRPLVVLSMLALMLGSLLVLWSRPAGPAAAGGPEGGRIGGPSRGIELPVVAPMASEAASSARPAAVLPLLGLLLGALYVLWSGRMDRPRRR
ncbi:MAG TPA: hypothetical protein VMZ51_00890 [Acidimicrobiales bacterium]|nr:hypothetical protein [Acidimicrobiales bacterium]